MLSFFRRASKSKIGTWVIALIGIGILAGFAAGDISNFGTGKMGFGMGSSTLAKVGSQEVTEREMSDANAAPPAAGPADRIRTPIMRASRAISIPCSTS